MESLEHLLPRDKHDIERAEQIKTIDRNLLISLLPQLLVFIQDMNWPVAKIILEILLTFPVEIVPHVQDVLSSDDDNWKWFILHHLIRELPVESKIHFKEYLTRVARTPTQNERAEELNEIATEILATI